MGNTAGLPLVWPDPDRRVRTAGPLWRSWRARRRAAGEIVLVNSDRGERSDGRQRFRWRVPVQRGRKRETEMERQSAETRSVAGCLLDGVVQADLGDRGSRGSQISSIGCVTRFTRLHTLHLYVFLVASSCGERCIVDGPHWCIHSWKICIHDLRSIKYWVPYLDTGGGLGGEGGPPNPAKNWGRCRPGVEK